MFKQLPLLLIFAVFANAVNFPTQDQYDAELRAAGMSESGVVGLHDLNMNFASQYVLVQSNQKAAAEVIANYTTDVENFVKKMTPEDQKIYVDSLKRYGLI